MHNNFHLYNIYYINGITTSINTKWKQNETTSIPQHSVDPRSLVISNDKRYKTKVYT